MISANIMSQEAQGRGKQGVKNLQKKVPTSRDQTHPRSVRTTHGVSSTPFLILNAADVTSWKVIICGLSALQNGSTISGSVVAAVGVPAGAPFTPASCPFWPAAVGRSAADGRAVSFAEAICVVTDDTCIVGD